MLINPFSGVVNSALSGGSQTNGVNRIQKAVAELASGKRASASEDMASLSIAKSLQNEITGLRSALGNTSQLNSLLQVADKDLGQIQQLLSDARQLASKANSDGLSDENRAALDQQFQSNLQQITTTATGSKFGGASLLDGSISGENALNLGAILGDQNADNELSIDSLDAENLLGSDLSIKTKDGSDQALSAIQQALNIVGTAQASVGAFSEQLDVASAYIETAITNQDAARSTLEDVDFAQSATAFSLANLQRDAEIAIKVQVKLLPPSMVRQLIS